MKLSSYQIRQFQQKIWSFYIKHSRILPWRQTTEPYKIFVSEVMLQQTQVGRVIPKYEAFISAFPTFSSLSKAPLAGILRVWSGLGYNRRAKYLKDAAEIIVEKYKGILPNDQTLVDELPGIGHATGASILVFSYNLPLIFIETNIRRVYIDYFFSTSSLRGSVVRRGNHLIKKGIVSPTARKDSKDQLISDKELLSLIEATLDHTNPRQWYFALMDYGAYLGRVKENPNRKSAHYAKQGKFEGSSRQLRGKILKLLIQYTTLKKKKLLDYLGETKQDKEKILNSLLSDRLIEVNKNVISIIV